MMYPFMTLNDDTEITHSEMKIDGTVKVYIETPNDTGRFHHATCWLPEYKKLLISKIILRPSLILLWNYLAQEVLMHYTKKHLQI